MLRSTEIQLPFTRFVLLITSFFSSTRQKVSPLPFLFSPPCLVWPRARAPRRRPRASPGHLRSYPRGNTASRPISEVKHVRALTSSVVGDDTRTAGVGDFFFLFRFWFVLFVFFYLFFFKKKKYLKIKNPAPPASGRREERDARPHGTLPQSTRGRACGGPGIFFPGPLLLHYLRT